MCFARDHKSWNRADTRSTRRARAMAYMGSFLRRLRGMDGSAEAIKTLAGYMLVNKPQAKQLVFNWLVVLRSAPAQRVLPLVYLANDVVQRAAVRKVTSFIIEFGEVGCNKICYQLRGSRTVHLSAVVFVILVRSVGFPCVTTSAQVLHEAMAIIHWRTPADRPRVNRVINIFQERSIFSANACSRWRKILHTAPPSTATVRDPIPLPEEALAALAGRPTASTGGTSSSAGTSSSSAGDGVPGRAGLPERPPSEARLAAASLSEAVLDAVFRQQVTTAVASRVKHLDSNIIGGTVDLARLQTLPRAQRASEVTNARRACAVLARLEYCAAENNDSNASLARKLRREAESAASAASMAKDQLAEVEQAIRCLEAARHLASAQLPSLPTLSSSSTADALSGIVMTTATAPATPPGSPPSPSRAAAAAGDEGELAPMDEYVGEESAARSSLTAPAPILAEGLEVVTGTAVDDYTPRLLHRMSSRVSSGQSSTSPARHAAAAAGSQGKSAMSLLDSLDDEDTGTGRKRQRDVGDAPAAGEAKAAGSAELDVESLMAGMVYNPIAREYQPRAELDGTEDWRD